MEVNERSELLGERVSRVLRPEFIANTRSELNAANKKIDGLSKLAIKIAFATGGLVSIGIWQHDGNELWLTKVGFCILALSTIFGGAQIIVDYFFYQKHLKFSRRISTDLCLIDARLGGEECFEDFKVALKEKDLLSCTSGLLCLIIQLTLLTVGASLVIIESVFLFH